LRRYRLKSDIVPVEKTAKTRAKRKDFSSAFDAYSGKPALRKAEASLSRNSTTWFGKTSWTRLMQKPGSSFSSS
jgi:hypothetical protein